jgi:hypothetical protein
MRVTLVRDDGEVAEEAEGEESDEEDDLPEEGLCEEDLRRDQSEEMRREIEVMLLQARQNGLPLRYHDAMNALITQYVDVFRLELGMDPPARVQPLDIELIDESLPERRGGRPRSFAPLQRQFVEEHINLLLKIGVIEK